MSTTETETNGAGSEAQGQLAAELGRRPHPGPITPAVLSELYPELAREIDPEGIQEVRRGPGVPIDMTGYIPQFVIDHVNSVLGPAHWEPVVVEEEVRKQGEAGWYARAKVTVIVGNPDPQGQLVPVCKRSSWGAARSGKDADALKGAKTDAMKKALAELGVGRHAYRRELDEMKAAAAAQGGIDETPAAPAPQPHGEAGEGESAPESPGETTLTAAQRRRVRELVERAEVTAAEVHAKFSELGIADPGAIPQRHFRALTDWLGERLSAPAAGAAEAGEGS